MFLLLAACGSEPVERSEPEEPPETEAAYAIHEWGFIAHHYADERALLTTGTAPASASHGSIGLGNLGNIGHGGKPVLYVHLQGEGDVARFTASLSTAGRFVEEWPHSENGTPTNLTWQVEARRGSCTARDHYPVGGDEHCTGIADHYCEAAELAHYETEDSACLTVDGRQWNHLFYRAQVAGDLPLQLAEEEGTFTVLRSSALIGRLMRIHRADEAANTRIALFDAPPAGRDFALPVPDQPAALGIAALEAELDARGMSEDEVGAFMTAWQAELFGTTAERGRVNMVGQPPAALRPKADALVYFMPVPILDAMVPLTFTPPPTEVRRAVLVRVDLSDAAGQEAHRSGNGQPPSSNGASSNR